MPMSLDTNGLMAHSAFFDHSYRELGKLNIYIGQGKTKIGLFLQQHRLACGA
jgi:hypothetical protein